jgi:hypothetical protein
MNWLAPPSLSIETSRSRLNVWESSDALPATKTKPIKFKEKDA